MIDKMFKEPTLLTKKDTNISFGALKNFKHSRELGAVALHYKEVAEASKHYPIFFVKDSEGFSPVALLGLETNKNLFVNNSGEWTKSRFVPTLIRLYPFVFTKIDKENPNNVSIAYDKGFDGLNSKDGQKFFNEDASLTEFGDKVMKFAEDVFTSLNLTKNMLKIVNDLNLFKQIDITLGKEDEKQYKIQGLFQIDGKELNNLNDENLLKLTKSGTLHLIYNHLDSSTNFDNLINKVK
jgi:hypothetical protein